MSDKAVLRVSDLPDWIDSGDRINWDRGVLGVCHKDVCLVPLECEGGENTTPSDGGGEGKSNGRSGH